MRTERLFVYGTLRDGDIRKALFGGHPAGTPDVLEGFARSTTTFSGVQYPNVVETPGESVEGELMLVNEETLRHTDAFETDEYERRMMKLKSGTEAWVYIREEKR